jgi:hypothetical protein
MAHFGGLRRAGGRYNHPSQRSTPMAESRGPSTPDAPRGQRLDSWKEIAEHMRRGVTTVQRWEREEGLPVHRHAHGTGGTVFAYTTEIDQWLTGRSDLPAGGRQLPDTSDLLAVPGDVEPLEPIGGAIAPDSPYYIRRAEDEEFERAVARRAGLILVKGARQMGKSSLLARGLEYARRAGARVVLTDLQTLGTGDLTSAEALFKAIGRDVGQQLGLRSSITTDWMDEDSPNTNFSRYVQRAVLAAVDGPLVWALDEVDRLLGRPYASDVFGLFRAWYNRRALDPVASWGRLTMAIAYATEAHLFISDANQSPFNVGIRLALDDFTPAEVAMLDERYGRALGADQARARLMAMVGGHPYLLQCAFRELARGMPLERLEQVAPLESGPLGDHLRRMFVVLERSPALISIVRDLLDGVPCQDRDAFFRLRSAGILKGDTTDTAMPRCAVYATYLRTQLL